MAVNLTFQLERLKANAAFMLREERAEVRKVLLSGASAYATSAAKHTPPNPGKSQIDPIFYADGVAYDRSSSRRAYGRRRIYDLLQLARNPDTGHYRKLYGQLLQQGYYYVVAIYRNGKGVRRIPCRTESEALKYAHETYRGLARAAWGLNIAGVTGKLPPAFRGLLGLRPELAKMAKLNAVTFDEQTMQIRIVNSAIKTSDTFLSNLDINASGVALRTMNDAMEKFLKRKFEL